MAILLTFLREYSWVLYIVSALGFIYFIFVGVTSMRDLNKAVFGMERSNVNARAGSAWVRAFLCLALAGVVFVASNLIGAQSAATQVNNIIANVAPTPAAGIVLLPTSVPTADFLAGQNAAAAPVITPTFIIQPAKPQAAAAEATPFPETPTASSALPVVETPTQAALPTLPSITLVPTSAVLNAALPTAAPVATATPRANAISHTGDYSRATDRHTQAPAHRCPGCRSTTARLRRPLHCRHYQPATRPGCEHAICGDRQCRH